MQPVTNDNVGPLIAYLVPGATVLLGVAPFSPLVQSWFAIQSDLSPTIGGFLFLTVASMGVGMTVSAIRWLVIDTLHRLTGLSLPLLDFSRLGPNVEAFALLIDIHYRHYLFYGNEGTALAIAYGCYRLKLGTVSFGWVDLLFGVLEIVFFTASRDCLKKYYVRSRQLLAFDSSMPH